MMKKYLYETYLEAGLGVSFKGQGLKWDTALDVEPVVKAIKECKNMKYLELEGNTLGVEAAFEIGKALESHPELEVALWKDIFTTRLKTEIPKALTALFAGIDLAGAHIQRLDLSDNAIGPVAMPGLTPFFETPSSFYVEELIVNNEGLGAEGGSTFAAALSKCLKLSESTERRLQLKVFQCGRNRQDNKGAMNWAKLFGELGTLEEVHMPQNGINPPAIKALAEAFKKNPNLRVINLEDNTVRADGAEMLAEILPNLVELEHLNLSDCLIKNEGAVHLGKSLRHHKNLRSVQLCANEIKRKGGLTLASILRSIPELSLVNLSGNEFGEVAREEIEKLLLHIQQVIIEDDEGEDGDAEEDEDEQSLWMEDEERELYDEPEDQERENESKWVEVEDDEYYEEENAGTTNYEDEDGENLYESAEDKSLNTTAMSGFSFIQSFSEAVSKKPQDDDAAAFIQTPSMETYTKLLPEPVDRLISYFRSQTKFQVHDLCIYAAVCTSKILGPNTRENFNALMDEALRNTNANGFATSLCVCLGYLKAEKGVSFLASKPTGSTVKALTEYLRFGRVPVTVFQCIQHFINEATTEDSYNILNPEYKSLISVIKTRLVGC